MCDTCGCNITDGNRHRLAQSPQSVEVLQDLLTANNRQAEHNRQHLAAHRVLGVNLMSSPGSGKTRLLETTAAALAGELRVGVIVGDLETENDAARIRRQGVPAVQITTGSACHLDAHLLHDALHHLDLAALDILFIENVGNLVCPASFDLGQHQNVVLLSTTEGDDKPAKYPIMFRAADCLLLSKADLLPVLEDFDPQRAEQAFRALANPAPLFQVSAKNGVGLELWLDWLRRQRQALPAATGDHHHRHAHPVQSSDQPNDQPVHHHHHHHHHHA